ncbi:MAG: 2OG-Fe(II) oxygenase family protein [Pseudomonadota bacterium]
MITINPALDPAELAQEYAAGGKRMQIRDFLVREDAERLYDILHTKTPWWLAFNEGPKVLQLPPHYLATLSQAQLNQILSGIQQRARHAYQYLYQFNPIVPEYFDPALPKGPILAALEFLNAPSTLDYFRTLTGRPDIQWADAHGTLFRSGNFLKEHTDGDASGSRLVAYVLNLTPKWERDWGGFLQFFDEASPDVEKAYSPAFNAMNLFEVPRDHSVGMVASFCPANRYSITGWFRSDAPPGPFGGVAY